jgi:hypothetical protein
VDDGRPPIRVVAETETDETPLLPGFELRLAAILAAADEGTNRVESSRPGVERVPLGTPGT